MWVKMTHVGQNVPPVSEEPSPSRATPSGENGVLRTQNEVPSGGNSVLRTGD